MIIEGYWICPHCKTKVWASEGERCPNCGHPKDDTIKFYLPDDIKAHIVSEKETKKISRNPDWLCSYCNALNSDDDDECLSCGASKDASEKHYLEIKRERLASLEGESRNVKGESRYLDSSNNENEDSFTYCNENIDENDNNVKIKNKNYKETSFSFLHSTFSNKAPKWILAILLCFLAFWYFVPYDTTLTIQDFSWQRVINIEEERTVTESAWSIPPGGRLLYTQEEFHHYEEVFSHYETVPVTRSREVLVGYDTEYVDLGNGYFETKSTPIYETEYYTEYEEKAVYEDVPVYQTKYYYEIDRWFYDRKVTTQGNDKNPYWGTYELEEKERKGSTSEYYTFTAINEEGKLDTYSVDYHDWISLENDQAIEAKTIRFGNKIVNIEFGN